MYQKSRNPPPPHVLKAILMGDKTALAHFGRKGVEKRNLNLEVRHREKDLMLAGTQEMAEQANEQICPVD